jgi:hypothetical protein
VKWYWVIEELGNTVAADPTLAGIFGTRIAYVGVKEYAVPLLEHSLVGDAEDELWNPIVVQWDIWTTSAADTLTAERRLRTLFHQDMPTDLGGMMMWMQFIDGDSLGAPDRNNVAGRAVRFRFTPLRSLYDPATSYS